MSRCKNLTPSTPDSPLALCSELWLLPASPVSLSCHRASQCTQNLKSHKLNKPLVFPPHISSSSPPPSEPSTLLPGWTSFLNLPPLSLSAFPPPAFGLLWTRPQSGTPWKALYGQTTPQPSPSGLFYLSSQGEFFQVQDQIRHWPCLTSWQLISLAKMRPRGPALCPAASSLSSSHLPTSAPGTQAQFPQSRGCHCCSVLATPVWLAISSHPPERSQL